MNNIAENIKKIQELISSSAAEFSRDPGKVSLVAVSKKQPKEKIQAAIEAGQRVFGENRVQEAQEHWADLKEKYPDIELHLIGPLQTNKVKEAIALFDVIQTLDRPRLADKLIAEMNRQNKHIPCFIQVNTGQEAQKSGVDVSELPGFYKYCSDLGLNVRGLMCIPPQDDPPALHFALLAKLAQELGLSDLSMGMSSDFEKAVALGATYVRVGTALFGERE
jgi:pyridoxal phosphate enzyme (YggS family)